MVKVITNPDFRWRLFEIQLEAVTMSKQTNTIENGNVYTVIWVLPDTSKCGTASRHPSKDELIDFCRRSMIEKIGIASIAISYQIWEYDQDDGLKFLVYDSANNS